MYIFLVSIVYKTSASSMELDPAWAFLLIYLIGSTLKIYNVSWAPKHPNLKQTYGWIKERNHAINLKNEIIGNKIWKE